MSSAPVELEPLARAGTPGRLARGFPARGIWRRAIALVAVAFMSWASVVDNPAVCPDEVGEQGEGNQRHDTPPTSHCCITAPCHTPTAVRVVAVPIAPALSIIAWVPLAHSVLTSIDAPAPPTPPPTSLD